LVNIPHIRVNVTFINLYNQLVYTKYKQTEKKRKMKDEKIEANVNVCY